ncbi:MAG: polysaccharide export protein [Pseudomonadota bacterium]|nr:polysaccharide export protein [Pseudomonadota bacterium]
MVALKNLLNVVAALFALCLVTACAHQTFPPAPTHASGSADADYLLGPGDLLNVVVWHNPEFSGPVPVRPDGKVSAPLVEDLQASGKTPTQLARDIEKSLARYLKEPVVTVIVQNFAGPYAQQVRVLGQVSKPQALAYRQSMTLLDVLIAVGGLTDFADGNRATIVRASGNEQLSVRLEDLVRRGDISANVDIRPGDVLFIPESWF